MNIAGVDDEILVQQRLKAALGKDGHPGMPGLMVWSATPLTRRAGAGNLQERFCWSGGRKK
jgi:hypothetical protein